MPPKRKAALVSEEKQQKIAASEESVDNPTITTADTSSRKRAAVKKSVVKSVEEAEQVLAENEKKSGKGLSIGDKIANDLEVVDEQGKSHLLHELFAEKGGVIFFYPKANTPGCTNQACGYRDEYEEVSGSGYAVFGMSADTPQAQLKWKEKYSLPYSLLCDRRKDHRVLKSLGVSKAGNKINRSHIVIGKGGVVHAVEYGVSAKESVKIALESLSEKLY